MIFDTVETVCFLLQSAGEIQGIVNASQMLCTVNDLILTNSLLNDSYIFFMSGHLINGE